MKQEPSAARQGIPVVHGREEVNDVYPANESGEVTHWNSQATLWDQFDHEAALRVVLPGYEVVAS